MPRVEIRPLSDLPEALPTLTSTMSMSRAHMVIDQLKSLVAQSRFDEIVFVTSDQVDPDREESKGDVGQGDRAQRGHVRRAGVVVYHPRGTDFATLLVAGWSTGAARDDQNHLANGQLIDSTARAINDVVEPLLSQRGVRFLQYATDVFDLPKHGDTNDEKTASFELSSAWRRGLGLQHIGVLEYQSGSTDNVIEQLGDDEPTCVELRQANNFAEFAQLVERTYSETLDCPAMAKFRTAEQTLLGYRQSDAFNPELWFSIHRPQDGATDAVGCLVLGTHQNRKASPHEPDASNANVASITQSIEATESKVISELVYMGLVPAARGSGLGKDLIKRAARISKQVGAQRMILAVDEANYPRNLYHRAGMTPIMRESVSGKSLSR